jgi:streptogramin lyase
MVSGSVVVLGAEFGTNKVFVFFPGNGTFKEYTLPTANSGPLYISIEPGGTYIRTWFTEWSTNSIGEIIYNPATGSATLYEWTLPAAAGGAAAGVFAGSGIIWFAGKSAIVKWDRAASQFTTWPIPVHPSTTASFVDVDSLGQVWYTSRTTDPASTDNYVGVLRGDNTFKEWQFPAAGTDPRVISISPPTQRPWIAEQGGDKIAQLDPSAGGVVSGPVAPGITPFAPVAGALVTTITGPVLPSTAIVAPATSAITDSITGQFSEWPLGAGSHPHDVVMDAAGNAWILESSTNKVGRLTLTTPDFGISVAPASLSIIQGASATTTTTVTSLAGFSLPVTLSATGAPAGLTVSFTTNPVTPPAGGSAPSVTSAAAAASTAPGIYVITIGGVSGALSHSTTLTVQVTSAVVPDFSIACSPSSMSMAQGGSGTSTCTVTSLNAFSSAVELSGSWVGTTPSGVTYSLPTPVTPPSGGTAPSTLSVSAGSGASAGTFTFRVTGTSGTLIHSTDVTVQIISGAADFTITASPSSFSLGPGASGTSTITVQSVGTFSLPVVLAVSGAPGGLTLNFGTNPVTPPAGGTVSSVLIVTVAGAAAGTYSVTVTGTSGAVTRSAAITIQVVTGGGGCLIATATYGSELSDEVQFLRNFRDKSILRTNTGSNFMVAFNAWYYSFSPFVAEFIREHALARTATKVMLYPLMGILRLGAASFYLFPANLEAGAVVSGLLISSLIGIIYLSPPFAAVLAHFPRARRAAKRLQTPTLAILLSALAAVALIAAVSAPAVLMMLATSTIVLAGLAASALFTSRAILRVTRHV